MNTTVACHFTVGVEFYYRNCSSFTVNSHLLILVSYDLAKTGDFAVSLFASAKTKDNMKHCET